MNESAQFASETAAPAPSLDAVLRRALRRQQAIGAARAIAWVALALCGSALVGALWGRWAPASARRGVPLLLVLPLGVLVAGVVQLVQSRLLFGGRAEGAVRLTRTLTREAPRLRSLMLSAIELRRSPAGARGWSVALVRAHAAQAAEASAALDLRRSLPWWPTQLLGGLALGALLLLLLVARWGPPWLREGFSQLTQPLTPPALAPREPITGDIALTFLYPAHTRLASRTVSGTNGEIQAPAGTQVKLTTRADRPVTEAALVVNGQAVALAVTDNRQLSGGFSVDRPGSYLFRFGPAQHPLAEGPPIPIAVQADAPPQVVLETPGESVEVDPKQVVQLRFRASDDYGLTVLRLVYRPPGADAERSVVLNQLADAPVRFEGSAGFDLAPLGLAPGDELSYAIEAVDNDRVLGPKAARSRSHKLKVFSAAEHHREALAQIRALWDRLVTLLGDRLDEAGPADPPAVASESPLDAQALELSRDLERAATGLLKDKSQDRALALAVRNVARGERGRASALADARELVAARATLGRSRGAPSAVSARVNSAAREELAGLERDVLYLEALLDRATSNDLLQLSSELADRRRELSALVERYRKNPDPALKSRVMAELNRLKARTSELLARMQQLAKGLSDQHLNREALAALHKNQDLVGGLSRAEDQLASGDLDGALKSLDQLASALDAMQNGLRSAQRSQSPIDPQLGKKVDELKADLGALQQQEQRIAEQTEKVQQEARRKQAASNPISEATLDRLRQQVERARSQLVQVPEQLVPRSPFAEESLPEARERVDELAKALAARDLDQARHSAEEAARAVSGLRARTEREAPLRSFDPFGAFGREPANPPSPPSASPETEAAQLSEARGHLAAADPALREVRDQLQKLLPEDQAPPDAAERQKLGQLRQEQAKASAEAEKLAGKLDQIGEAAPLFDPAAKQAISEARGQMDNAQQRLGQGQPSRASEEERGALSQLDRLAQSMRGSKNGSAPGGLPSPFAMEPEHGEGGEGAPDDESEKVVVPGADQYQVPAAFRRDILDAMKQKAPSSYEGPVRRYYQEIVK